MTIQLTSPQDFGITKDDSLKELRSKVRQEIKSMNGKMINRHNLSEADYYISENSPFIVFNIKPTENVELIAQQFNGFAQDESVLKIFIESKYGSEDETSVFFKCTSDNINNSNYYQNNTEYKGITDNGDRIVIGQLETYVPNINHDNFEDTNITIYYDDTNETPPDSDGYTNKQMKHATLVASIFGGKQGIASEADIVSKEKTDNLVADLDYFVSASVNAHVLNISAHYSESGMYTSYDAIADYYVTVNKLIIVKSAGNNGTGQGNITSPGLGNHVITVGNLYTRNILHEGSSFFENTSQSSTNLTGPQYQQKPDLVAIGSCIDKDVTFSIDIGIGTSFSAPVITGTIAALLSKHPDYIHFPGLVRAIVVGTASMEHLKDTHQDYLNGTWYNIDKYSGYENKVGAGEIDIDAVLNHTYNRSHFTISDNTGYISIVENRLVHLEVGDKLTTDLWWETNVSTSTNNFSNLDLDLIILDPNGNTVIESTSQYLNKEKVAFVANQTGFYEYNVIQNNNWYSSYGTIDVAIGYQIVEHKEPIITTSNISVFPSKINFSYQIEDFMNDIDYSSSEVNIYKNSVLIDTKSINSQNGIISFTGLMMNTEYEIEIIVYYDNGSINVIRDVKKYFFETTLGLFGF